MTKISLTIVLAATLLVAIGCDGPDETTNGLAIPTNISGTYNTVSVAEAGQLLGAQLRYPTYIPDGLEVPDGVVVGIRDDGVAISAYRIYARPDSDAGSDAVPLLVFLFIERMIPPPNLEVVPTISVGELTVAVGGIEASTETNARLIWLEQDLVYTLVVAASSEAATDVVELQEIGVRVIESLEP